MCAVQEALRERRHAAEGLANACTAVIVNQASALLDHAVTIDLTVPDEWQKLLHLME